MSFLFSITCILEGIRIEGGQIVKQKPRPLMF